MPQEYVVQSGDSLWSIAKSNGVTLIDLQAANQALESRLPPWGINPGDKLTIPASTTAPAATGAALGAAYMKAPNPPPMLPPPKAPQAAKAAAIRPEARNGASLGAKAASPSTGGDPAYLDYTVTKGDNLWQIAKDHNVTLEELKAANPQLADRIPPYGINPGDQIKIPSKLPPISKTEAPKATTKPCALCVLKPCDVQEIVIFANVHGDKPKMRKLATTKVLRSGPSPKGVSASAASALKVADLVIDVVASYPSPKDPKPVEKVAVQCNATYMGKCSLQVHPLVTMTATSPAIDGSNSEQTFKSLPTTPEEYYAKSTNLDFNPSGGKIGVLFELIASMWPGHDVTQVFFLAQGCGVWPAGYTNPPNVQLWGLIRIFRKDKWSISLSIPPLGKYEYEKSKTKNFATGEVESSKSTSKKWGNEQSKTTATTTTSKDGNVVTKKSGENWKGSSGEKYSNEKGQTNDGAPTYHSKEQSTSGPGLEVASAGGHLFQWLLPEEIKKPTGVKLVVKRNGKEIEILETVKKVIEAIKNIAEIVKTALDAIKRIPQFGWKITLSIAVLEGSLEGEWGPIMTDKVIEQRYLPVETYFSLIIKFKLFEISLDLSFGFDADIGLGTKFILKAGLTCSLNVPLEANIVNTHEPITIALKPEATFRFNAKLEVSVLGWSLINAQANLDGGLSAEGKVVFDPTSGPKLSGELKRKKIVFSASFKRAGGDLYPYKNELVPEKPLASF